MPRANPDYVGRINRVLDYIDAHLADPLDLARLAAVAHVSPWHFHRIFQAFTGETLAERVRRRRVEIAAGRLLGQRNDSALAISLDVGFASAEVFTRTFRAHFGVTPTAWRRGAYRVWMRRHAVQHRKIRQANRKDYQELELAFRQDPGVWPIGRHPRAASRKASKGAKPMSTKVEIRNLPETRVAYMRYVGPYGSPAITEMWMRFERWCQAQGFMTPRRPMYGIAQDNPNLTAPDKLRYDACIEVDGAFKPSGDIGVQTIWGGRYACTKFTGAATDISEAWMRFMRDWLPQSRLEPAHHPAIELYDTDFSIDPKTFAFSCLLCLPVH